MLRLQDKADSTPTIHAVVVTYGSRRDLLYSCLDGCRRSGVHRAILVDNGARWNVSEDMARDFPDFVTVVSMGRNRGSSPGFKAGLLAAIEAEADLILVLDDDLAPTREALERLTRTLQTQAARLGRDSTAVVGFRHSAMERMIRVGRDALASTVTPPILQWPGNHVLNRLLRATRVVLAPPDTQAREEFASGLVRVRFAPYGGLLMHREVVARVGLPDEDFVLYWDDVEWTHRISASGGRIFIDMQAPLIEMEVSHPFRERLLSRYHSTVLREGGKNDYRVYYEVRNAIHFAQRGARRHIHLLGARILAFWLATSALALAHGAHARGRTIRRAISDGLHGRMGYNQDFPLE